MEISTNELQVLVNTNKVYLDKNNKFKYSLKELFNNYMDLSVSFKNWFEGYTNNNTNKENVGGIAKAYSLVDGVDYIVVNVPNGTTMHVHKDYRVTLAVYCLIILKYNLSSNTELVDVLHSYILARLGKKASLVGDEEIENLLKINNLL